MSGRAARSGSRRNVGGLVLAIGLAMAGAANAGTERDVVVNGRQIAGAELDRLDRADCRPFPDGSYWLNRRSGAWGPAGETAAQGRIGDGCRANKSARPKSRSIARPARDPAPSGTLPDEGVKREEPITGTSPLLRSPGPEPDQP